MDLQVRPSEERVRRTDLEVRPTVRWVGTLPDAGRLP